MLWVCVHVCMGGWGWEGVGAVGMNWPYLGLLPQPLLVRTPTSYPYSPIHIAAPSPYSKIWLILGSHVMGVCVCVGGEGGAVVEEGPFYPILAC